MAKFPRIDLEKAAAGVWHDYHGIRCLIARMGNGNAAYQRRIEELAAELHEARGDDAPLSDDDPELRSPVMQAVAETVLLDWENAEDDEGNPLEYSPEVGYAHLTDPELADFRAWVLFHAGRQSEWYRRQLETEGNSSASD